MDTWIFWMGAHWGRPRLQWGSWAFFLNFFWSSFWVDLGTGRDQKIDQNRPCGQKGVPKDSVRCDFCARAAFFSFSPPIWAKNVTKINEILNVFFRPARVFFQTGKSQILCTGAVFWAVFTFSFLSKNCKNLRKKSMKKVKPEKWPKMTTRGVPE